ncbi:MAG: hypothetical protein PHH98_01300 [Candidatus Gracilibacteria bacterium]|nr:hypothetical protein [Candidatus Gracilibacteria bacterium]
MNYNHKQNSCIINILILILVIILTSIYIYVGQLEILYIFLPIMLFVFLLFNSLNVEVDDLKISIKFGYIGFRKSFLLSDIKSVKKVRNHWYFGWGIRVWFWPYMWIYNINGFDAIEIVLKNNRIYRIGTNDVENLEKAIQDKIK